MRKRESEIHKEWLLSGLTFKKGTVTISPHESPQLSQKLHQTTDQPIHQSINQPNFTRVINFSINQSIKVEKTRFIIVYAGQKKSKSQPKKS